MMNDKENDDFMSAFDPIPTNGGRKSCKRRSSILKAFETNYGEERRTSRRVSWANTYQYKELLADGTAVIKSQEMMICKSDDILKDDSMAIVTDDDDTNVIDCSDIKRFKPNSSDDFTETLMNKSMTIVNAEDDSDIISISNGSDNASIGTNKSIHYMSLTTMDTSMSLASNITDKNPDVTDRSNNDSMVIINEDEDDTNIIDDYTKNLINKSMSIVNADDYTAIAKSQENITFKSFDSSILRDESMAMVTDDEDTNVIDCSGNKIFKPNTFTGNNNQNFTNKSMTIVNDDDNTNISCSENGVDVVICSNVSDKPSDNSLHDMSQPTTTSSTIPTLSRIQQPLVRKMPLLKAMPRVNVFSQNNRSSSSRLSMGWLAQSIVSNNTVSTNNMNQTLQIGQTMPNIFKRTERKSIQCAPRVSLLNKDCNSQPIDIDINDNHITGQPISSALDTCKEVLQMKTIVKLTEIRANSDNTLNAETLKDASNYENTINAEISTEITDSSDLSSETKSSDSETKLSDSVKSLDSETIKQTMSDMSYETSNGMSMDCSNIEVSNSNSTSESSKEMSSELSSRTLSLPLDLTHASTSPLSISMINSTNDYLVSSPTTVDKTLNFTFNEPLDEDSNSFDPFIHTNRSFHANASFYDTTTSPMQLSFIVRQDTLCILTDQLEKQMEDIVIPAEDHNLIVITPDSTEKDCNDMFTPLKKLDAKELDFTYEVLNEDKAIISFLWATFALEVKFGGLLDNTCLPFPVRHIIAINMKSMVTAEDSLQMRQKDLMLKFEELHKPLITIAHDLIISYFQMEEQDIKAKHKTSSTLDELLTYISVRAQSAKKLLIELRVIQSAEICRFYPKDNKDRYRLVVEILGIIKPIHLIFHINAKSYPDEVIRPNVRISAEDKHYLCGQQFSAAFLRIQCRKFDYIKRLIRGAKAFIKAKKTLMASEQMKIKQKKAIESAKLSESMMTF
ncbi:uncharacterized protein LOC128952660 isoform X1 [Oppia nitens]|uniref:uncharacterized protein LOC128952660 isoform X1 n=1 Tax=Oppia nitens TaxID=1686743 RepID=UPI0023D9ED91|nr:uncharacterized protein LOC128952660 isoform X1 [Oppia nitens]